MGGFLSRLIEPITDAVKYLGYTAENISKDIIRTVNSLGKEVIGVGNSFVNEFATFGAGVTNLGYGFLNEVSQFSSNLTGEVSRLVGYIGTLFGYIQVVLIVIAILLVVIILGYVFRGNILIFQMVQKYYKKKYGNSKINNSATPEATPLNSNCSTKVTVESSNSEQDNGLFSSHDWSLPLAFQRFFKSSSPNHQLVANGIEMSESKTLTKTAKKTSYFMETV